LKIEGIHIVEKVKEWIKGISKKQIIALVLVMVVGGSFLWAIDWANNEGQTFVWDMISNTEENLRDLYSNSTQTELKAWLPDSQMNFTDGLIWESKLLNFTFDRPKYKNVTQVLKNGKGACGEFAWVFGAFCVANDIPFRFIGVGYFVPSVVDHNWIQVNPSSDGETWIHIDVADTCDNLKNGKTIDELWNRTINNNSQYAKLGFKMVIAYEINQNGEIVITDVTETFIDLKIEHVKSHITISRKK
jgi:hypothetical protein